jgi:hypothetical protein
MLIALPNCMLSALPNCMLSVRSLPHCMQVSVMEGRLQASQQELASAKLAHGAELAKHMTVRMKVLATASRPSLRMQVLARPLLPPPPCCPP